MKIIIIGPAYPYRGGIADTNESLCRALQKQGHDVKLVTFSVQYPNFLFPGKTQFRPDKKPKNLQIKRWINSMNPMSWVLAAKKINQEQADVVIIRYWLPFLAPCLGTIGKMIRKKTKVLGFCDNILPHEKRPGDQQFSKYFISACDGFISMSKTVEKELGSLTNKKITCIPHPINDNLGERIPKKQAKISLKLEADCSYILFFGLVRKYKGLDLLLEAMTEEKLKNKNVKLLVAGEFYDDKEKYMEYISANKLKDKVILVDQFIPTEEIKLYFSAVDIVAQTYHTASQSGVSLLAYNFNCPILVTDVGGLSETVPHMKVGYVVKKDGQAIAKAIMDFFDNNREQDFIANIKVIKKQYTWEEFAEKLIFFAREKINKH